MKCPTVDSQCSFSPKEKDQYSVQAYKGSEWSVPVCPIEIPERN